MRRIDADMQACIDECLRCHQTCLGMAMTHCLEQGGRHVEPDHFRLMIACAELCRAAAAVMLTGSPLHVHACAAAAEACAACASSCDGLDGMQDCVIACRDCADSCRRMAGKETAAIPPVRQAGPESMENPPKRWDIVDEQSDESFPASDPPGNY
jgi:hypothetical protein